MTTRWFSCAEPIADGFLGVEARRAGEPAAIIIEAEERSRSRGLLHLTQEGDDVGDLLRMDSVDQVGALANFPRHLTGDRSRNRLDRGGTPAGSRSPCPSKLIRWAVHSQVG
jgi:hypothetical protein